MDWTASVVDVMLAECRQLQASTAIAEVQSMISWPNLRNSPTVKSLKGHKGLPMMWCASGKPSLAWHTEMTKYFYYHRVKNLLLLNRRLSGAGLDHDINVRVNPISMGIFC